MNHPPPNHAASERKQSQAVRVVETLANLVLPNTETEDIELLLDRISSCLDLTAAGLCFLDENRVVARSIQRGSANVFALALDPLLPIAPPATLLPRSTEDEHAPLIAVLSSARAQPLALLWVSRLEPAFAADDRRDFLAVAAVVASAIDACDQAAQRARDRERHTALARTTYALATASDVEGVLQVAGQALFGTLPFRQLLLYLPQDGRGAGGGGAFSVRSIEPFEPGQRAVVRLRDSTDSEINALVQKALVAKDRLNVGPDGVQEALLPVAAGGPALGVLCLRLGAEKRLRPDDLSLLECISVLTAVAIQRTTQVEAHRRPGPADREQQQRLRTLGELAAGVAHDFNNVLAAILGRAHILREQTNDQELLKNVGVIEQAALDAAGTVRRIQEYAREKSGRELAPLDLNRMVEDTVERARTRLSSQAGRIVLRVQFGDRTKILGSASELRQVLTNLIFNAVDAMPDGGGLDVRTGLSGTDRVWFEVEDSGLGMDEETQSRLFTPFFTTKGSRGTGLGLSVARGIIQRHRGAIEVWSEVGRGTRIRVSVPVIRGGPASEPAPPGTPVSTPAPGPVSATAIAAILVIDDDAAVREVLSDILRTADYRVVSVASGAEGLERLEQEDFDLVFTDLGMPGMNGWEVAAGVKLLNPTTVVGLITGWEANLDEERMKAHGIDLVVPKPFRVQNVLDEAAKVMSWRKTSSGEE